MAKAYINGTEINKFVVDGGGVKIADGTKFAFSTWEEFPEQYEEYINKSDEWSYMFSDCTGLTSLNVSKFDSSNVTNMQRMFHNCNRLISLDLNNFNTSNVTDMEGMFRYCKVLTSLDVSSFNTSNVTDMGYMFHNCESLTSLDLSSFDTSKVTNMHQMFNQCTKLQYVLGEIDFATMYSDYNGNLFGYSNNNTLRQITVKNLGFQQKFTKTSGFDKPQNWGVNSDEVPNARQSLIDSLITYSYDRASAGYSTCTITLSANLKAVLSEDEIAQITAKGFTIA